MEFSSEDEEHESRLWGDQPTHTGSTHTHFWGFYVGLTPI
jgi:hypothetical protein